MREDVRNELKNLKKDEVRLLNKSELARRLGCNRRTVDKYLQEGVMCNRRKKREYASKLDDYKSIIIDKVDTYGATAMAVYKFIQKKGYVGGYGIVNNFVKKHKKEEIHKATIRFETAPGLQAQVDWKEKITMTNRKGEEFIVNIFLMVLGYSRLKFIRITTDKVQITCRPYRAQTKGKLEALAKFVDRLKVYNGEFDTYEDLEKITNEFMEEINSEISQATGESPFQRFEKEKEYLGPLPSMFSLLSYFSYHKEYKVSKESMVTYKGRKYSVPVKYIGYHVNIFEDEDDIRIYYIEDLIECHPKCDKVLNYKHDHVAEILKTDALKHLSDSEIDSFIKENLNHMDILLK